MKGPDPSMQGTRNLPAGRRPTPLTDPIPAPETARAYVRPGTRLLEGVNALAQTGNLKDGWNTMTKPLSQRAPATGGFTRRKLLNRRRRTKKNRR